MINQPLTPYTLYIHHDKRLLENEEAQLGDYLVATLFERLMLCHTDLKQVILADGTSDLDLWLVQACERLKIPCVVYTHEDWPLNPLVRYGQGVDYELCTTPDLSDALVGVADRILVLHPERLTTNADHPVYLRAKALHKTVYWVTPSPCQTPFVAEADLFVFASAPSDEQDSLGSVPPTLSIERVLGADIYTLRETNHTWQFCLPDSLLLMLGKHPGWSATSDQLYRDHLDRLVWLNFLRADDESGLGHVCRVVLGLRDDQPCLWLHVAYCASEDVGETVVHEALSSYMADSSEFVPWGQVQLPAGMRVRNGEVLEASPLPPGVTQLVYMNAEGRSTE